MVVADGDTLEVLRDGRAIRVRLAGIDAPETGQPWSRRARTRLSELVFRRDVGVVVRDVDRYGRDVVDVTLADGRRVNDVLVSEGLAWFYATFSKDQGLARLEAGSARGTSRRLVAVDSDSSVGLATASPEEVPLAPWRMFDTGSRAP